jgi:hypothetical protein
MAIWIGNILSIPIYAFVLKYTELGKKQQNSVLIFIMFCQLLFLTVFKDNRIFKDLWAYLIGFNYSKLIDWSRIKDIDSAAGYLNYELGWRYYVKTLSSLSDNEGLLIFITGIIILYSYLILIKKHSTIPWISVFLFIAIVFYNSLFVLRQNLAIAICIFSFPFIVERKLWKFLLIIIFASLFHNTAIIFAILYFLYPLKLNKKMFSIMLVGGFLFNYLFTQLIEIAITYFPEYAIYYNQGNSANIIPYLISFSVLSFIYFQFYPIKKFQQYEKLFFIMIFIVTLFDLSRVSLSTGIIARLSGYFFPAIIILLPNAINNIKTPIIKYMSISTIVSLYFLMMIRQMDVGFRLAF